MDFRIWSTTGKLEKTLGQHKVIHFQDVLRSHIYSYTCILFNLQTLLLNFFVRGQYLLWSGTRQEISFWVQESTGFTLWRKKTFHDEIVIILILSRFIISGRQCVMQQYFIFLVIFFVILVIFFGAINQDDNNLGRSNRKLQATVRLSLCSCSRCRLVSLFHVFHIFYLSLSHFFPQFSHISFHTSGIFLLIIFHSALARDVDWLSTGWSNKTVTCNFFLTGLKITYIG